MKLEIGQVWAEGARRRQILNIIQQPFVPCQDIRYKATESGQYAWIFEPNFQKWIARTGAELEEKP
jgi:hypothetical protein